MIRQQIALVQAYIHHLKGKEIDVAYPNTPHEKVLFQIMHERALKYFI